MLFACWLIATCTLGSISAEDERARKVADPKIAVALVPEITRAEIEAHVRFLAADERKGRVTGTASADVCARYLASVFEKEGLEPAGDDGTYLQAVPMVRTKATDMPEMSFVDADGHKSELVFGVDFDLSLRGCNAQDLRVEIVHVESDLPKAVDARVALFVDATISQRKKWLEAAGLGEGRGFGVVLGPGSSKPGAPRSADSLHGGLLRAKDAKEPTSLVVRINGGALERLRKGDVKKLSIATHVVREEVSGSNVVARIRGRGASERPELAAEAVVFTAHYDHLDEGTAHASVVGDDRIFNGADDDASGCAAVLEIAGAFAHAPPPARTLVFALVTGEEIGLLGTYEYLDRPVVPLDKTVANLNFEMIGRADPKVGGAGNLWLTGFELTNLGPAFEAAGIAVKPDPYPGEHFFERSDNIAFVHRGVVGQTFSTYNLHKDYHAPSDEADRLDYAHMEACVRAGYAASRLVADGEILPAWAEGKKPSRR